MKDKNYADVAYSAMLKEILEHGERRKTRTGTEAVSLFGLSYFVDLEEGFPIITTKQVPFELVAAEYLWFLSGQPHINELQKKTSIWDSWANDEGYVETAYGRYWRRYPLPPDPMLFSETRKKDGVTYRSAKREKREDFVPTPYEPFVNRDSKYVHIDSQGYPAFDQIEWLVDQLRENPQSRRMNVTAWYPPNSSASKLPPCHHSWTVSTLHGRLNIEVHQRSGDMPVGVPFNMSGYALIAHLLAQEVGMEVGYLKHNITDAHIYEDQIPNVEKQLRRSSTGVQPEVVLPDKSLFDLTPQDAGSVQLDGYKSRSPIKFPVAV